MTITKWYPLLLRTLTSLSFVPFVLAPDCDEFILSYSPDMYPAPSLVPESLRLVNTLQPVLDRNVLTFPSKELHHCRNYDSSVALCPFFCSKVAVAFWRTFGLYRFAMMRNECNPVSVWTVLDRFPIVELRLGRGNEIIEMALGPQAALLVVKYRIIVWSLSTRGWLLVSSLRKTWRDAGFFKYSWLQAPWLCSSPHSVRLYIVCQVSSLLVAWCQILVTSPDWVSSIQGFCEPA